MNSNSVPILLPLDRDIICFNKMNRKYKIVETKMYFDTLCEIRASIAKQEQSNIAHRLTVQELLGANSVSLLNICLRQFIWVFYKNCFPTKATLFS